jgi:hypothetical protein
MNMRNTEYKPIILIGAGFTGCDLLHLKIASYIAQVPLLEFSEVVAKLRAPAELASDRIKELIETVAHAPMPLNNHLCDTIDKKSKYIRKQHRLAVKFSNRRR